MFALVWWLKFQKNNWQKQINIWHYLQGNHGRFTSIGIRSALAQLRAVSSGPPFTGGITIPPKKYVIKEATT